MSHGQGLETLAGLGHAVFRNNRIDVFFPEKTRANGCAFLVPLPANEAAHARPPNVFKPLEKSWSWARSFAGQSH